STQESADSVSFAEMHWGVVLEYCHRVLAHLRSINAMEQVRFLRSLPERLPTRPARRLALKRRHHFLTMANEVTLESNGYSFAGDDKLMAATENGPYIRAIRG